MGCIEVTDLSALTSERICETINKYFSGLNVRNTNINDLIDIVKKKVLTRNTEESADIMQSLEKELTNNEFYNASKKIITKAKRVAKEEYNDDTLAYQSLFFLAGSDLNTFTNAFKTVNIGQKGINVANQISNVKNNFTGGNILGGIFQGINAIQNTVNLGQQVSDPNSMPKEDLLKFLKYHVNFVSLLPVEYLKEMTNSENSKIFRTVNYVLENAFGKSQQESFINKMFLNYQNGDKINIDNFFQDNYQTMKDDKNMRLGLVNNFIGNLSPKELIRQATNFFKSGNVSGQNNLGNNQVNN